MGKKLTTEGFIERARAKHNNYYSYDLVKDYKNSYTKVVITCPVHGPFEQRPSTHLEGFGCRKCGYAKIKRATTNEFVVRAKEIHGDLYDYHATRYTGSADPITAICAKHGEFTQSASEHLRGRGCQKCGNARTAAANTKSLVSVLETFKQVHGDLYNYDQVQQYTGIQNKITILCRQHGPFKQTPHSHLKGHGCPRCGTERAAATHRSNTEEFIEKAQKVHKDVYLYDRVDYRHCQKPIELICKQHGVFEQTPTAHLEGQGCPRCGVERRVDVLRSNTEEFIEKAQKVHKDVYLYDRVDYRHCQKPIELICKQHGVFEQTPAHHLVGKGCPYCRISRGERAVASWLDAHNVAYATEWTDHNCIAIRAVARFDFYLPKHNTIIEYDGEQHFKPLTSWFGNKQTKREAAAKLREVQQVDAKKTTWAVDNGYTMIRIRFDEDVASILDARLALD